jgi:ABC-type Zn uptake system ZnuABC Zn-binding protein ZnuA
MIHQLFPKLPWRQAAAGLIILLAAVQCGPQNGLSVAPAAGQKLKVVATTSLVADTVTQVGGEFIDMTVLLPVGSDPHSFEPTPRDLTRVADADIIFANGVGLEAFLKNMLTNAGGQADLVEISDGIELRQMTGSEAHADEHGDEHGDEEHHEENGADPHVWTSPVNVIVWTQNIEQALSRRDPAHAAQYQANAQAYRATLQELDAWVKAQVVTIPPENRELVTDHAIFGYFADRYGFTQVGAVIPAFSATAEPSANTLAQLTDAIKTYEVKAIFVGNTVSATLSKQMAADTGVTLAQLYTDSLGPAGSGVETYVDYIRANTTTIVEALR